MGCPFTSRRPFTALFCLAALALAVAAGPAPAADSFSGDYFGICVGLTNNTGPDQHYSYWAYYTVNTGGTLTGGGQLSKQGGDAPPVPLNISSAYQIARLERVLMGLGGAAADRAHGRLRDDMRYAVFIPLHDDNNWYLNFIGRPSAGSFGDERDLDDEYWYVQYQINDPSGGPESHRSVFGTETYDGAGNIHQEYSHSTQGVGSGSDTTDTTYSLSNIGLLQRYATIEKGYRLDLGIALATSRVAHDDAWGISLSSKTPTPGYVARDTLHGPYWLAMMQYNSEGGADQHSISLGKAYFDGVGGVDMWITRNIKGVGLTNEFAHHTYTVNPYGVFTLDSFTGGVEEFGRVVLAAEVSSQYRQGIMILLRQSGIEDLSPMCHLLGLTP